MPKDRNKDAASFFFKRPQQRLRRAFLNARREQKDSTGVANQIPIAFGMEVQLGESPRYGMSRVWKSQIERAMTEFGSSPAPGQTKSIAERLDIAVSIHREMEIDQSTAAFLELIEFSSSRLGPIRVVRVEDHHICFVYLFGRGPTRSRGHRHLFSQFQEFGPTFLPQ